MKKNIPNSLYFFRQLFVIVERFTRISFEYVVKQEFFFFFSFKNGFKFIDLKSLLSWMLFLIIVLFNWVSVSLSKLFVQFKGCAYLYKLFVLINAHIALYYKRMKIHKLRIEKIQEVRLHYATNIQKWVLSMFHMFYIGLLICFLTKKVGNFFFLEKKNYEFCFFF